MSTYQTNDDTDGDCGESDGENDPGSEDKEGPEDEAGLHGLGLGIRAERREEDSEVRGDGLRARSDGTRVVRVHSIAAKPTYTWHIVRRCVVFAWREREGEI